MSGSLTKPALTPRGLRMTPCPTERVCHRIGYAAKQRFHAVLDRTGDDAGFTLIEVITSFIIFAIVAGGAVTGIVNALGASHTSQQRVDAANIAQAEIASARTNAAAAVNGTRSSTKGVENEQFTVVRRTEFTDPAATQCSPGASFTVHVQVFQKQKLAADPGTAPLARTDSVIAC